MKIAIAGATGFLGSALSRAFHNDGHEVRGLVHERSPGAELAQVLTSIVQGDLADTSVCEELTAGMDLVINTVSNFRALNDPPEAYQRTNVEGTKNLFNAARDSGVLRFVHCSTIGVHGDVQNGPANENSPYNPGDLYQETKLESERYIQQQIGQSDTEVVIIRPCSMYGPGDTRMLKLFKMLSKPISVMIGDGQSRFHPLYIDDAVNAFRLGASHPSASGQIFIVGQPGSLTLEEYLERISRPVNPNVRFLKIPYGPVLFMARLSERLLGFINLTSPLTERRLRFYRNNRDFDVSKSEEILGFTTATTLEEGAARTAQSYRDLGWL